MEFVTVEKQANLREASKDIVLNRDFTEIFSRTIFQHSTEVSLTDQTIVCGAKIPRKADITSI